MSRYASVGFLMLAAFLVDCGKGAGGDGDGGVCPAGSVASVNPSSVRVTAGGPTVTFGGGASNCVEPAAWSLAGPGSIAPMQGSPIVYTPPASVSVVTQATLTATVGGLTASAAITIDPATLLLAGKVIGRNGHPVPGATVRAGVASAKTDVTGVFSLAGVAPPYDIVTIAPGGLLTSYYPGLRRMDPTLFLDVEPSPQRSGTAVGALSGGAGFPQPAGHEAGIAFLSGSVVGSGSVQAGTSLFTVSAGWSGPSTVTGDIHALQWQVDAQGKPVSYDGQGSRTGVTLTSGQPIYGQDIVLAPVATTSLAGTFVNQPGTGAGLRLTAVLGGGARIPIWYGAVQTPFSIATPAIPGATVDLVARIDYAGMAFQEVHRSGLAPGATGVAMTFSPVLPMQSLPPGGAVVGPGTTFSWFSMPGNPVYMASFRGPPGSPGYDLFTTGQSITIPPGTVVPSGASYEWKIVASTASSTVDGATGPGGFLAPAPEYLLAQTPPWTFTTAP